MFFKKISCNRCGKKVSKGYGFCPFCGNDLEARNFEGKISDLDFQEIKMPFPFGRLFNQLTKELSREFDKLAELENLEERKKKIKGRGISISVSNVGGVPKVKIGKIGDIAGMPIHRRGSEMPKITKKSISKVIGKEQAERYAKLPRKEAETSVRRLSESIVYEISLPGVKNIQDVFVHKLKNSIEVKAFGSKSAYFKLIPLDLYIKNFQLKDEKLILELKE